MLQDRAGGTGMKPVRLLVFAGSTAAVVALAGLPASASDEANGAEANEPATDLVDVVRRTPLGCTFDRLRIRPFGWVEASVSTSPGLDADERRARVFDVEDEGLSLHQAYFALERQPETGCCFDLGAKVAVLWGSDARFLHARGLFDDQDGKEQFDLLEAKAIARFPVARGLTVSAGKFTTPLGFEVIEAPNNLLPSRSLLFGYAIPFTHTGTIATLEASERWKLTYGIVQGWDVWDDGNGALTHLGGVAWTSATGNDAVIVNGIVGPEQEEDESDLRVVVDGTWTHSLCGGSWTTALNADFGIEEGAATDGGVARWWGAAGYLTRKFSDRLSATARLEWFRDEDGTRLGEEASLGELTLGVDWRPVECLPNLRLRPEVRWDHSFDGEFFDDGRDRDQLSLTLDVVFTF
jgi:hypothetical protein